MALRTSGLINKDYKTWMMLIALLLSPLKLHISLAKATTIWSVLIPEDTVQARQFLRRQGWTNIQNLIVRGLENFQIFNSGGRGVGKIE